MKNVHEIEIKVEGKEWEDAITKSFNKNVQNVKVDGFRKGKVPRNIFEKKFGKESLYNDAIDFVLQEKYATVIKDSKLIPIIQPTIDIKEIDDEKLVLTFRITTKPEVKVEKYTKLGVKKGVVKVTEEEVKSKFGALYTAFQFGAPPHAGIAPGFDRMLMLLTDSDTIRDVIAFPLNSKAQDLMMGAPGEVKYDQLKDIHIKVDIK